MTYFIKGALGLLGLGVGTVFTGLLGSWPVLLL